MPIVWKTSFEEPLNKLMLSGTIGNSKQLVNSIALLYDTSVKQGLPMAPGTPAGPLLSGNIIVFKKMLNLYFKLNSIKNQAGAIKTYAKVIKSIILNIKTVQTQIKTKSTELKTAIKDISKTTKEISKLQKTISSIKVNAKTSPAKMKKLTDAKVLLIEKRNALAKYKIIEVEAKILIDKYKEKIVKFIKPKIQLIKDELKKLIKKILFPQLQETKLTLLRKLPTYIKRIITEYKQKKKEIVDKIKKNVQTVKQIAGIIIKVVSIIRKVKNNPEMIQAIAGTAGQLSNSAKSKVQAKVKSDGDRIKKLAKDMVKSPKFASVVAASSGIMSIIESYPDKVIPREIKDECRKAVNKIPELKYEIELKKEELKNKIKAKLKEKRDELIKSIKPRGRQTPAEKIQELRAKKKELQTVVKEVQSAVRKLKELILIVRIIKKELPIITKLISKQAQAINAMKKKPLKPGESMKDKIDMISKKIKYKPNAKLVGLLEKQSTGLGKKYESLNSKTDLNGIKTFLFLSLIEFLNKQEVVKRIKDRAKKKIKEIKDKIIQSRNPIQTALFNKCLKLAVAGYWTGGSMILGFVTSPGVVIYRVPMKMTTDATAFPKNLARAFMLHTKTVSGIYLQPSPSGAIPIPWVGYI